MAAQAPVAGPVDALPGAGRPIAAEAFRARRDALAARLGSGIIVVPAAHRRDLEAEVLQDNDFRQDDYFFYLTGLEAPGAWLLMAAGSSGQRFERLYLRPRNIRAERWTGRSLGPGPEAAGLTGIADVAPYAVGGLLATVDSLTARLGGPVHVVVHAGTERDSVFGLVRRADREIRNLVPVLDSMRLVKDEVELASLRRAIEITAEAHKAAMRAARPGMYEYQLEATIEYTFRNLGADRVGFPSIVGSGPNTTVLHYDVNRRQMQADDLVVMDIGAEYGHYSADVTRTIPVSGRFTQRQKAMYDLVLAAQQAAIEAVRPGATVAELNRIARDHLRTHSGNLCGATDCSRFFIHGLSHWLGMRVHDVGDYGVPLEPGMVLTIEPGVYLPDEELGIRIEDDVLVTEDGYEVLSRDAPRTTEEIERLMQSSPEAIDGGYHGSR
jgi:Xaa-Pro aminopeptidase